MVGSVKTSDGITGYIAGGLGNQLFILAAAWEQAQRLHCPLYLNTSYLSVSGLRSLEVDQISHPGIDVGPKGHWTSKKFPGDHIFPVPRSLAAIRGHVFFEKDQARFDPKINTVSPGTMLIGYFQSAQYFPHVSSQLAELIRTAPVTDQEQDYLDELAAHPGVTLHLRRGDYQAEINRGSIVASADYARRALTLIRKLGNTDPVRVFSDSPEQVKHELAQHAEQFEFVDNSRLSTGIATIKAMSQGTALVMSNSSFSWWAGWLMEQRMPGIATVISPRPWNETGTARADMLYPTWLSVDARS